MTTLKTNILSSGIDNFIDTYLLDSTKRLVTAGTTFTFKSELCKVIAKRMSHNRFVSVVIRNTVTGEFVFVKLDLDISELKYAECLDFKGIVIYATSGSVDLNFGDGYNCSYLY